MIYEFNNNIISFSGRKESGKTELANICADYGYIKISFATALKKLVCFLLNLSSIDDLNQYKTKPIGKTIDDYMVGVISEETGIGVDFIKDVTKKITNESTGRDWLQVIGTDLIREKDPDWHVRKTFETMRHGKKYVIDDTRFPNELNALKEIGAECWFIIRNKTDNISNHKSETSLSYNDFDYNVIVNNSTLEDFRKNWKCYLEYYESTSAMRRWLLSLLFINQTTTLSESIMNRLYVYSEFKKFKDKTQIPGKIIEKDTHDGFICDFGNPFIMEDLKKYYKKEA